MGAFLLDKWYFDAADENGRAAIVHAAVLRFGLINLHYGAILASDSSSATQTHHATIRAGDMPITSSRGTAWTCDAIDLSISCSPPDSHAPCAVQLPPPHRLLDRDDGFIDWAPIHRRAMVDLRTPDFSIRGLGYAERLTMTLRPWDLPINVMQWGRWIGESASMVWLRWEGPMPKTLVLLSDAGPIVGSNAADSNEDVISTGASNTCVLPGLITANNATLSFSDSRSLRDESLADSLVSIIPGLRTWTPARTLAAREHRWLSRGTLTRPHAAPEHGWAIHEEVRFDGSSPDSGDLTRRANDPRRAGAP